MPARAPIVGLRCSGCSRVRRWRDCPVLDEPMAPFGPERCCPDCGGRVLPWCESRLACLLALIAASAGWGLGRWLASLG